MNFCLKCNKRLRSDNLIGYCRTHRHLSPIFIEYKSNYIKNTKNLRKEKYKNRTEEEKQKFREVNRIASAKYRAKNKDKRYILCTKWNKNNPEKYAKIQKKARNKLRSTPKGNLDHRMSVSIQMALKANKSRRSWESLVGYSVDDLKLHLESKFTENMTWEELLKGKIHIDHIIPKSAFNYSTPEDENFKKCWSLSNLQPLWAIDNLRKSNKILKK